MELIIFIPALFCAVALFTWGPQLTLVRICLPVLLLFPMYFVWKIQGVPSMTFSDSVFLPLGAILLLYGPSRWKPSRTDLWIALYFVSCFYADLQSGGASLAKYRAFGAFFSVLLPYAAGKLLIEQDGRRWNVIETIVSFLSLSTLLSIPEFFVKLNLYQRLASHFFSGQWPGWVTQIRWGFGRVAGPLGSAELYGLILIVGLMLGLYMHRQIAIGRVSFRVGSLTSKTSIRLILALLLLTLVMTGSRGPWLGALIAISIARIGKATRVRRAAVLTGLALVLIALPAYTAFEQYASGPRRNFGSERETAQYRREMLENYLPLAERGGPWGYGTFHPIVGGQVSIDNEFLRVFLTQGYVGLTAFVLLFLEGSFRCARIGLLSQDQSERHYAFSMLGILWGWIFTLSTVFMGGQNYELFFLLAGWFQAMPMHGSMVVATEVEMNLEMPAQQRVFT